MTENVIPLPFRGDLIDYIKLHGREIEWLWRDGEAYIPARPICELLGLAWPPQYRKLTDPESEAVVTFMVTTGADGKRYEMLCIAYPDFLMWLAGIEPSRVKAEAREALRATRREIRLVVASFYQQRLFGETQSYHDCLEKLRMEVFRRKPLYGTIQRASGWRAPCANLRQNRTFRLISAASFSGSLAPSTATGCLSGSGSFGTDALRRIGPQDAARSGRAAA